MAANIPVQQQQQGNIGTPTPVPVTLVTTMPMGVPPLAQLTPSAVSIPTTVQTIPMQVQNTLATNSMQVPSVVPSSTPSMAQSTVVTATPQAKVASHTVSTNANTATQQSSANENTLVSRSRLQDLVREVDATETLDDEVEDLLLQLADDFVESTVNAACLLAKHRKATTVEVRDVQLHLERNWNMWTPGFGTDELRPYKRAPVTEAHKQRLALIRKAIKKY